ncbi:right-handed parallel beta-helix repeat-containing protein [Chryseobacterium sp. c4a]|uniref:right-handed parallel beta-helix repeat-containing protein n=1 Tax=Chryseobacterium sp. c4a TaxID=1573582 RepID=UPI00135C1CD4|nr:right-handed parallel beta-helix repeat-containing protein [Chryseobacterium sp. c4a]
MKNQFLTKNTMDAMYNMCSCELDDLQAGVYAGVKLLGYYQKGDTPAPIIYYPSPMEVRPDDRGSVVAIGTIKLVHNFINIVDVKYYGVFPNLDADDTTIRINRVIKGSCPQIFIGDGEYKIAGDDRETKVTDFLRDAGGIEMLDNKRLIMSDNCYLIQRPTNKEQYNVIRVYNKKNVFITGGNILGDRYTHTGTEGEWGYGIAVSGGSDITLKNIKIKDCWGDGLNIQHYYDKNNILHLLNGLTADKIISSNNRRQGMSIEGGENLYFTNCAFNNSNGTSPECGVDIEPWDTGSIVRNVVFDNCEFLNNNHAGLLAGGHAKVSHITIQNSKASGNKIPSTSGGQISSYRNNNNITIKNSVLEGNANSLYGVSLFNSEDSQIIGNTFKNCMFNNQGLKGMKNLVIRDNNVRFFDDFGGVADIYYSNSDRLSDENVNHEITNNTILNDNVGIRLFLYFYVTKSIIQNNLISNYALVELKGKHNVFESNQLHDAKYLSLNIKESSDYLVIRGNIVSGCAAGDQGNSFINVEKSDNLLILDNIISKKSYYTGAVSPYTNAFYINPSIQNMVFKGNTPLELSNFNTTGMPSDSQNTIVLNKATNEYSGALKSSAASGDTAGDAGSSYSQTEVQAILAELRDLKSKLRVAKILAT